jgi:hypothetical protein
MATRRYSLAVGARMDQVTDAVGAATVTAPIELTVDWATIQASGLSSAQARMQVDSALMAFSAYLQSEIAKLNLPG